MFDAVPLEELRRLCAEHWSPIGVPMSVGTASAGLSDRLLPADEYDAYLATAWNMAARGLPAARIRDYLASVETDLMGLSNPAGDKDAFIRALREGWTRG